MCLKKNRRGTKATLCFAAILLFLFAAGCKKDLEEKSESIEDIQKRQGIPVRVLKVEKTTISSYEILGGTAEGFYQTTISAKIPGKITGVHVEVGDNVNLNQTLFSIEPDNAQNFNLAKTQYETSKKSRERLMALAEQGGVSQEIVDQVEAGYIAAKENMDAIRKSQFVPAPFAGTVVNVFLTNNSRIAAEDKLAIIANIDKIRIPLVVSDVLINKFRAGLHAIAMIGDDSIVGKIDKVSLSGQELTHTFVVEAVFNNPHKVLKPGMYIPVKVVLENKKDVIALPLDAVNANGSEKYVFTVVDSIARKVPVKVGIRDGELLEIVSGLNTGDMAVIFGASMLMDGKKIRIVE